MIDNDYEGLTAEEEDKLVSLFLKHDTTDNPKKKVRNLISFLAGNTMVKIRTTHDLKQNYLSHLLGISVDSLINYEKGKTAYPLDIFLLSLFWLKTQRIKICSFLPEIKIDTSCPSSDKIISSLNYYFKYIKVQENTDELKNDIVFKILAVLFKQFDNDFEFIKKVYEFLYKDHEEKIKVAQEGNSSSIDSQDANPEEITLESLFGDLGLIPNY